MKVEYTKAFEGAHCEIWLAPSCLEAFNSAAPNDRRKMERILKHLSEHGPNDLNVEQFRSEGRYPCGEGKKAVVYVAKAYQLRIYGCFQKGPPRILKCPEWVFKKKDKADQKLLKRVAMNVGE